MTASIQLKKLRDCENPQYANHIEPGYVKIGSPVGYSNSHGRPAVEMGKSFTMYADQGLWKTSTVMKIHGTKSAKAILSPDTDEKELVDSDVRVIFVDKIVFETKNSVYEITMIDV